MPEGVKRLAEQEQGIPGSSTTLSSNIVKIPTHSPFSPQANYHYFKSTDNFPGRCEMVLMAKIQKKFFSMTLKVIQTYVVGKAVSQPVPAPGLSLLHI